MGIVRFFLEAVETLGFEQTGSLVFLGKKGIIHRFDTHGISTLALKKFFEKGDYEALKMMFQGFEAVEYARIPWQSMNKAQKIGTLMFLSSGFEDGDISWGGIVPTLIENAIHDENKDVRLWSARVILAALSTGRVSPVKILSLLKDVPDDITPYLYTMGLVNDVKVDAAQSIVPFIVYGMIAGVKADIKPIWDLMSSDEKKDVLKYVGMAVDAGEAHFHDGVLQMVNVAMEESDEETRHWAIRLFAAGVFHGDVSHDVVMDFIGRFYTDEDMFIRIWVANILFHGIRQRVIEPVDVKDILLSFLKSDNMELFEKVLDIVNLLMTTGKLSEEYKEVIEKIYHKASEKEGEYWESVKSAAEDVLKVLNE